MQFIDNLNIHDPRINLALEEYCLRNLTMDHDYLLFYINDPSVIIGKHQNTLEEVNMDVIGKRSIVVVRRISGGGAVYHDHGNLNFSFMTKYDKAHFNNYQKFTEPVIKALHALGVNAELTGRNDIVVDGRKISGNAQFTSKDRMFSHGTLLFDSHLEDVVDALNVKAGKIESKGIKSIRSRVANISEFMKEPMSITEFREYILKYIFGDVEEIPRAELTENDWKRVHELAETKYSKWDWNFGESPEFNVRHAKRFPFGEVEVRIMVEKGFIENVKFYGDFFSQRDIGELENLLTNIRYEKSDLEQALKNIDMMQFFGEINNGEFLELLY